MSKKIMRQRLAAAMLLSTMMASGAHATGLAETDSFYSYTDSTPLAAIPLGTVLKQRTITYHLAGIATPVTALQLLYRTSNAQQQAVVNVTSIIKSPHPNGKAISYQSAYDSLNPYDSPSRVIAGDQDISKIVNIGSFVYNAESFPLAALTLAGYDIIVPDTQGMTADFAAGPEEGMTTLDSIRAALHTPATGLTPASPVALIGYSGGAIGTDWAAQLAPSYAPDVNKQLVGAAFGGLLIDPVHNIAYVDGSIVWGGVAPMALVGLARAYNVDLTPYLNSKGLAALKDIQNQSIAYVLPKYLGLTWETLLKPEYVAAWKTYQKTGSIGIFKPLADLANKVNAGQYGAPTIPIYFTQGSVGVLNGTFMPEPGDGVMLADDARTLVQQFCKSGTDVQYIEVPFEHVAAGATWAVGMLPWLNDRFAGKKAPNNCWISGMLPGRSLAPIQ